MMKLSTTALLAVECYSIGLLYKRPTVPDVITAQIEASNPNCDAAEEDDGYAQVETDSPFGQWEDPRTNFDDFSQTEESDEGLAQVSISGASQLEVFA